MSHRETLESHLVNTLSLPEQAVEWLLMVWDMIQLFDDVADSDPVERADLDRVIWFTFVGLRQNSFDIAFSSHLLPVLSTMILKWQASDDAERHGYADEKSFVWRAGYYDLILLAVSLVHGQDVAIKNAHVVMGMYGESYQDYLEEFTNA
jgi:hypothetical protein